VTGKLFYQNKPAVGAMLKLLPENAASRLPTAIVKEDGSFAMSYNSLEDGAPTGKYRLLIVWMRTPTEGGLPLDYFRGRYSDPKKAIKNINVKEGSNDLGTMTIP
jgi:hypothetical protein